MPAPLTRRQGRRNETLIRVLRLVRLLRDGATLPELATGLGCTTRTIRRDFALLRAVGMVVTRDKAGTWVLGWRRKV